MNSLSLAHPETQRKLFVAMQHARIKSLKNGCIGVVYVYNSKGEVFLRVKHERGIGKGFTFSHKNKIINKIVLTALRKSV